MVATLVVVRDAVGQPAAKSAKTAKGGKGADKGSGSASSVVLVEAGKEKKAPKTLDSDKEMKKLQILMMKCVLKSLQSGRDTDSVVFDTYLCEAGNDIVQAIRDQGLAYAKGVKNKGHGLGPPHIWALGGALERMATKEKEDEQEASPPGHLQQALATYSALSTEGKCDLIRFFKLNKCFRQDQVRITLSFAANTDAQNLRCKVTSALVQGGCEAKFGRAPPTNQERELQAWLDELLK